MEAHGGYLCRLEEIDSRTLVALARRAVADDGADPDDCSLLVSLLPRQKVIRLAFDAGPMYGRKGARWYEQHHALAKLMSSELGFTVHAYVFDPDELEQVVGYGNGRRVGGETMRYEDAELPDEDNLDDLAFERMKARWPLGHLAKVLGVAREELVRIARCDTVLLDLCKEAPAASVRQLFEQKLPSPFREAASAPPARAAYEVEES